jgi:hypothetical protein
MQISNTDDVNKQVVVITVSSRDVLIIQTDVIPTESQAQTLKDNAQHAVEKLGVRCLFLTPGAQLTLIKKG